MLYIRFESPVPNSHGEHTGIFGLANGLARSGRPGPSDYSWWRANNDWLNAAYPNPASADPTLFDRSKNPVVTCWFKSAAAHLLDRVPGYLSLLDRHGIAWTERRSNQPGHVLYHDDVQVVVAPFAKPNISRHKSGQNLHPSLRARPGASPQNASPLDTVIESPGCGVDSGRTWH